MIIAIDMAAIDNGMITENYLTNLFETTQIYDEYADCSYAMVAEVVDELSAINETEADNQAEYEKSAARIQQRIEELNDIISEIWGKYTY